MVVLRRLDSSFVTSFRELLQEGLSLGPMLSNELDLSDGSLSVWAPEERREITPQDLRVDIFPPETYQLKSDVPFFLTSVLDGTRCNLIIGETYRTTKDKPLSDDMTRFPWLIVPSAIPEHDNYLCICSLRDKFEQGAYWECFEGNLTQHPSILLITESPTTLTLVEGEFVKPDDQQLAYLRRSTKYILAGVFDEMSMMVWCRNSQIVK